MSVKGVEDFSSIYKRGRLILYGRKESPSKIKKRGQTSFLCKRGERVSSIWDEAMPFSITGETTSPSYKGEMKPPSLRSPHSRRLHLRGRVPAFGRRAMLQGEGNTKP